MQLRQAQLAIDVRDDESQPSPNTLAFKAHFRKVSSTFSSSLGNSHSRREKQQRDARTIPQSVVKVRPPAEAHVHRGQLEIEDDDIHDDDDGRRLRLQRLHAGTVGQIRWIHGFRDVRLLPR